MNGLYLDTSGLFAALVSSEPRHEQAKACLELVLLRDAELIMNSFVLLETMTLLQARVGLDAAKAFETDFRPSLKVVWMDEALYQRSVRRWQLRRARKLSLTDCSSFAVMEELGLQDVFGYDRHFSEEGFHLVGTPGDL